MTVVGPYRLLRTLGMCEAGKVWSAFDAEGTSVTVAVIDGPRGASESWLQSFGHRTDQLAMAEQLSIVDQDLTAAPPWIAVAWDGGLGAAGLFTASGLNVTSAIPGRSSTPAAPAAAPVRASSAELSSPARASSEPVAPPPVAASAPVIVPSPVESQPVESPPVMAPRVESPPVVAPRVESLPVVAPPVEPPPAAPPPMAGTASVVGSAPPSDVSRQADLRPPPVRPEPRRPEPVRPEPVRPDPVKPDAVRSGTVYGTAAIDASTAELSVANGPGPIAPAPPARPIKPAAPDGVRHPAGRDPSTAWQEIDEPVVAPVYLSQNAASSRSAARRGRRRRRRTGRAFLIVVFILMLIGGGLGVYVARFGPIDIPIPGLSQNP